MGVWRVFGNCLEGVCLVSRFEFKVDFYPNPRSEITDYKILVLLPRGIGLGLCLIIWEGASGWWAEVIKN